jgi:hypothetical protein
MIARIENISRSYAGYILKVHTYDYDEYADDFSNEQTTRHDFATADELEAYCAAHDLAVDTDGRAYEVHEWHDGMWLEVNAEPAHQLDPLNY